MLSKNKNKVVEKHNTKLCTEKGLPLPIQETTNTEIKNIEYFAVVIFYNYYSQNYINNITEGSRSMILTEFQIPTK